MSENAVELDEKQNHDSKPNGKVPNSVSIAVELDDPERKAEVLKQHPELEVQASVREKAIASQSAFTLGKEDRVTLTWDDVSYTVISREDGSSLKLLDGLSGVVRPGELLGVMGPSGSGKTTLLDLLAGRLSSGTLQGDVLVNGHDRDMMSFRHYAGYVPQETSLVGTMTVRETLNFSAQLSLPEEMDEKLKHDRVETVLGELGLAEVGDTRIGNVFLKGISGGQVKRVSIGVELLTLPTLLFLDEPTSGLDSSSALRVMEILQRLTAMGHTVVCSIHQPSSDVFHMLDRLLLLNRGRTVYFGDAVDVLPYFEKFDMHCPPHFNPADFVIRETNTDFKALLPSGKTIQEHVDMLVDRYKFSDVNKRVCAEVRELDKNPGMDPGRDHKGYSVSTLKQFIEVTKRTWSDYLKNPAVFWVRWVIYVTLSLMIGTMYFGIGNGQKDITDRIGILFYIAAFFVFMSIAVIPAFIAERAVFARERANGWYDVGPYVLANTIVGLPGLFVIALTSSAIVYPMVGLNSQSGRFWLFLLNLFLSLSVAESIMALLSALIPIYIVGMALGSGIFGMFMLSEGFFIVRENIPDYWLWGYYIAFHTYSFRMFMWTEFSGLAVAQDSPFGVNLFKRGEDVLLYYNMENEDIRVSIAVLVGMMVGYRILFYLALRIFQKGKR